MSNRPIFFQETEASSPKRRSGKRWLAALTILLVASVLALGLAEIATRLLFGNTVVLFPRFHTDVQYGPYHMRRLEPSTSFTHTSVDGSWEFTTNAQGFRDTNDYTYEKTPGVDRVLCLGDSHTQGFEVHQDQTYATVIERRLKRLGHPVEVLNTGISGFGTAEQLAFFENEGIRYKPDVVVLGWFINDFDDNEKTGLFRLKDGVLSAEKFEHIPGVNALKVVNSIPGLEWAGQHSYFYSLLFNRVWEARKSLLSQQNSTSMQDELTTRVAHQGAKISKYQLDLSAALVQRLYEVCKKHGIRLLVLDIPWVPHDNTGFSTSMPPEFASRVERTSDALLRADDVLGPYVGVADIFVPHGQRHISETSHLMFGMEAAKHIADWWKEEPNQ